MNSFYRFSGVKHLSGLLLLTVLLTVCWTDGAGFGGFGGHSLSSFGGHGSHGGYGGGGHNSGYDDSGLYHVHLVHVNKTIKCAAKGGTCLHVNSCESTQNIFKVGLCGYNYSIACCISREIVCSRNWGYCHNVTSTCRASGNYFSWFACNDTHRCCRPYVKKLQEQKSYGYGGHQGGHGNSHGGGYGNSHGGGYGNSHGGGHNSGYGNSHGGGGYGNRRSGGYGNRNSYGKSIDGNDNPNIYVHGSSNGVSYSPSISQSYGAGSYSPSISQSYGIGNSYDSGNLAAYNKNFAVSYNNAYGGNHAFGGNNAYAKKNVYSGNDVYGANVYSTKTDYNTNNAYNGNNIYGANNAYGLKSINSYNSNGLTYSSQG